MKCDVDEISNKDGHTTSFEPLGVMLCSLWKTVRKICIFRTEKYEKYLFDWLWACGMEMNVEKARVMSTSR